MNLKKTRISVSVLMMLLFQSGYGAPSTFTKAARFAVLGNQKAAVKTIVDNGQGHRLRVIDSNEVPTEIRKLFSISDKKVIDKKTDPIIKQKVIDKKTDPIVKQKVIDKKFETNPSWFLSFNLSKVKKQIEQHEVISFDVFDTLLLRPYIRSSDLFMHLERLENAQGFAKARIEAERAARRRHSEKKDISFDEIYAEIAPQFKSLQSKEMALERQTLTANPEIKEAFDYALQQGKRVVITSDMYLPTSFLQQVLEEKGYTGFHKIYVSGDIGKSKHKGSLFDYLLKDEKIENAASVLHIGDSNGSDKNMAEKKGISAIWYPKRIDRLLAKDKRAKIFYDEHKNELDASILLGMLALHNPTDDYWHDFGYTYAGPTILGFMKWLDNQAQRDDCKEILFVARDGYTPEKVFNIIKTDEDIRTHYVYSSRRFSSFINFDYVRTGVKDLNSILNYFKSKNEFLNKNTPIAQSEEEGIKFIEDNKDIYFELVEKERQKYAHYFDQFELRDEKLMLVDSISCELSAQRSIVSALPQKSIEGCYWVFRKNIFEKIFGTLKYHVETYQSSYEQKFRNWRHWNFMELLMTAPTPSLDTIDDNGKPVFLKSTEDEVKRIEIYPHISDGAVKFAQTYVDIFDKKEIYFSSEMLVDWVNIFFDVPTKTDKEHFIDIKHGGDRNHSRYYRLMEHWYNQK